MTSAVPMLAALLMATALLAGCSDGGKAKQPNEELQGFGDPGVKATDTTGVLLGVVVDPAIRPLSGATVAIRLGDGTPANKTTDTEGRFAFGDLTPGTYFIEASLLNFKTGQSTAEVVAGEDEPKVHRVQLEALFNQAPYAEQIKLDGYLACAYAFSISSTCINDYTRLVGFIPGCEGGCLKDFDVAATGGNIREFVTAVGPGWQALVMEMVWEPSLTPPVSQGTLGMTVSFFERPSTGHWYGQADGPNPLRLQLDVGVEGPNQSEDPALIPPEGLDSLFVFMGAGNGDLAVQQSFRFFQTNFYYNIPPADWSFARGDPLPF